ncbi:MAG: hypothetical protein ACRC8W_05030 [Plesiomonas shigelloides]
MSNIDKRAYRADGGDIGISRLREIGDNPYGDEEKCWLAKRVLALLDELEAKDKRIADYQDLISGLVGVSSSILREVERINNSAAAGKGDAS